MKNITILILLLLAFSGAAQQISGKWKRDDNSVYYFNDNKAVLLNVGYHLKMGNFYEGEVKIKDIKYNGQNFTGLSKIKDTEGRLLKWKEITISQLNNYLELQDTDGNITILTNIDNEDTEIKSGVYGSWKRVNDGSIYKFEGNLAVLSRIGWRLEQGKFQINQVKVRKISFISDNLFSGETRINGIDGKVLKWEPVRIIINDEQLQVRYTNNGKSIFFIPHSEKKKTISPVTQYVEKEKSEDESIIKEKKLASIDVEIPKTTKTRSNTYALIIGNEDYTKYQSTLSAEANVDYASNDARIFYQYCNKTLGIPKDNLKLRIDGISSQMKRDIKWLTSRAKYGGSNVDLIFYYAGHGFPDPDSKDKYIMPVDITGSQVRDGIKLADLYNELTTYPSKKVTVFLDACFSGGGREQGLIAARGVKIKPRNQKIHEGKLIVFSGSSGDQESLYYEDKNHGIFTYYLLKKIQETEGNVNYEGLRDYLRKHVPLKAIDLFYKEQVPEVNVSYPLKDIWKNLEL